MGMKREAPGSAVPYQCPYCGESYRYRRTRTSPIRNFRVGFAKTTQLLASELMARLRSHSANPEETKLVSFADSRQDAARAALDLERRHHEDVRREYLVSALRSAVENRRNPEDVRREQARLEVAAQVAAAAGELGTAHKLLNKSEALRVELANANEQSIPLVDLVDVAGGSVIGRTLKPVTAALVSAGIHPIDPAGIDPISVREGEFNFSWQQLFQRRDGRWVWADHPGFREAVVDAHDRIKSELRRLATETIFHRTHFSFEEAGFGYACVPTNGRNELKIDAYNALVRILGDKWRYSPRRAEWTNSPTRWIHAVDASRDVRNFAKTVWGGDWKLCLDEAFDYLRNQGHRGCILQAEYLRLMPVAGSDPFWRCSNCGRIHLHLGGRVCTRCFDPLRSKASGRVQEIRSENYLAKRVEDPVPTFRLRAEELTAMTSNQGARLRRFKGILIDDQDDILPRGEDMPVDEDLDRAARVVDVLSVTTTMEVGVDIGSLEAVFQANMPPQRFNYQQRVGRAGRRGRPFSVVLTVCRSKSHDLHYFRYPEAITGDPPPPPFLTSDLTAIGRRLLRKAWLWEAFRRLRCSWNRMGSGENWPADDMTRPDIHGEFLDVDQYWRIRKTFAPLLRKALTSSLDYRDEVADWFAEGTSIRRDQFLQELSVDDVLGHIEGLDRAEFAGRGIGEALAEQGQFPMYGMPTRVRNLYTGPEPADDLRTWEPQAIGRDLEVAIQEFAPGRDLVKDKKRHRSIGFTGPLPPRSERWGQGIRVRPLGDPFGHAFWLVECPICRGWMTMGPPMAGVQVVCKGCRSSLSASDARECVVPNAFRTSFFPTKQEEDLDLTSRQRLAMAEAMPFDPDPITGTNMCYELVRGARVFRLNRGAGENWSGFSASRGRTHQNALAIENQWIMPAQVSDPRLGFREEHESRMGFFLAAPKVTDSLVIAPRRIPYGLTLSLQTAAGRAAVYSAAFLLIYKAAQELDVDPNEFEIVTPRTVRLGGLEQVPLVQFCDSLLNGSGLCDWLVRQHASGDTVAIAALSRSILVDADCYPLTDFASPSHRAACDQSCYVCLNRYSNQSFHGLLDWRLGLDALSLLMWSDFRAGLDGRFSTPGLLDWPQLATGYAEELSTIAGPSIWKDAGIVPLACLDQTEDLWCAVVHPLWNWNLLLEKIPEVRQVVARHNCVIPATSFDLARRPVTTLERLRHLYHESVQR